MVCAIGDENGRIMDQKSIPTKTPEETMPAVIEYFENKDIKALGIASFGPVELDKNSEKLKECKKKLDEIGVPSELVFFPGAKLPHGYMDQMEAEPHAREAFSRMMRFIQRYI